MSDLILGRWIYTQKGGGGLPTLRVCIWLTQWGEINSLRDILKYFHNSAFSLYFFNIQNAKLKWFINLLVKIQVEENSESFSPYYDWRRIPFFFKKNVGTFCDREKYEVSARKILSYNFMYFCYFMIPNY